MLKRAISVLLLFASILLAGAWFPHGGGGAAFTPQLSSTWWQRWQLQGHNPAVVLDFANGLYYNGTTTLFSPSTLVNNGTVTGGSGLACNANNISVAGAALSAFQGNVYTIENVTAGGANDSQFHALVSTSPDGSTLLDQVLIQDTSAAIHSFKTSGSDTVSTSGTFDFTKTLYWGFANSITGGYRTISGFQSGNASTGNDATALAANPFAVFLCSLTPQFSIDFFGGTLQQTAIINGNAPAAGYQFLPPAFKEPNSFWYNFNGGTGISYNNILQFEYTQPFTTCAAINVISAAGGGSGGVTGIIYSNVPALAPYPGHEFWLDGTPNLRVRLINDFTNHLVDVVGGTNMNDGKWHMACDTNTGSGTAAGIKIYVDGVLESMTTIADNLNGLSIKSTDALNPNCYFIGNQSPATGPGNGSCVIGTQFAIPGAIGLFRQSKVVRPLSYIQNFKINMTLPPIDGNDVLAPKLSEGGTSTTTADQSSNNFTGSILCNSAEPACWLRQ